ncbi:hypothetical protein AJ78_03637 [Emergomyces pasteurianus Ep9510]|uniref:BZIP domain-containing protein n=1 Tax=Emergomyces pasteurianus Ep9510 TaxID=1447872 RepID=A0A1J9QLX5_9EURO|nr:hypothetical protein AJ78_03637 [Emergomyces pasteurianus Ep9510]
MPQPAETVDKAIAKRRARNRVSQKSFRERQARYIKDLERRVAESLQSENTRLNASQEECRRLREALATAQTRINSLVTALSGVAQNIAQSIDETLVLCPIGAEDGKSNTSFNQEHEDNNEPDTDQEGELPTTIHHSEDAATAALVDPGPSETPPEQSEPATIQGSSVESDGIPQHFQTEQAREGRRSGNHGFDLQVLFDSGECEEQLPSNGQVFSNQPFTYMGEMNPVSSQWAQTINNPQGPAYLPTPLLFPSPKATEKIVPHKTQLEVIFPPGSANFPSVFSAHMAVCEYFTKQNPAYRDRRLVNGIEPFSKLISTMVHAFVNTCWPEMRVWWAFIQSSKVVEKLMRWKLDPCMETYNALPITHRPTALQLCAAYPGIVDWVFFPSIRDRLIEVYSHSWLLDEISCELVRSYVVEAELTKIVTGMENLPAQKGYFRIWDIVQTISLGDLMSDSAVDSTTALWEIDDENNSELFALPASPFEIEPLTTGDAWTKIPLEKIFQSRQAALKLFNLLRMDDRRTVKLDPAFAAAHPELSDDPSIIATGLDCTLHSNKIQVPRPKPLSREAIMNYKAMLWKTDM